MRRAQLRHPDESLVIDNFAGLKEQFRQRQHEEFHAFNADRVLYRAPLSMAS